MAVNMIITRGLPASGKSTWAQAWVAEVPGGRARVNRDDIRSMLNQGFFLKSVTEGRVIAVRDAMIRELLKKRVDVVVDETCLSSSTVRDLLKLAAAAGAEVEIKDLTDVPLETCIERDDERGIPDILSVQPDDVGEAVIRGMYERYLKGKPYPLPVPVLAPKAAQEVEPYVAKPGTPKAVLVDLDGTVALLNGRSPYDETRVSQDEPNPRIIELVHLLAFAGNYLVFMSGRTAGCMHDTMTWLDAQGFEDYHLYMRNVSDTRKDAVVKLE